MESFAQETSLLMGIYIMGSIVVSRFLGRIGRVRTNIDSAVTFDSKEVFPDLEMG